MDPALEKERPSQPQKMDEPLVQLGREVASQSAPAGSSEAEQLEAVGKRGRGEPGPVIVEAGVGVWVPVGALVGVEGLRGEGRG